MKRTGGYRAVQQAEEFGWTDKDPSWRWARNNWAVENSITFSKDFYAPKLRVWVDAYYYFDQSSHQFVKGVYHIKMDTNKTKSLAKRLGSYLKPYEEKTASEKIQFAYGSLSYFEETGVPCLLRDEQNGCVRLTQKAQDKSTDETIIEVFRLDRSVVWEELTQETHADIMTEPLRSWETGIWQNYHYQDMLLLELAAYWSYDRNKEERDELYELKVCLDPVLLLNRKQYGDENWNTTGWILEKPFDISNEKRDGGYYYFAENCRYLLRAEDIWVSVGREDFARYQAQWQYPLWEVVMDEQGMIYQIQQRGFSSWCP